jgi:hypothetical protein
LYKKLVPLFSRDFPYLVLWPEGASRRPALILYGHHGKSSLIKSGEVFRLKDLKINQVLRMKKILDETREKVGYQVPIIVAGDFNLNIPKSHLMRALKPDFVDAFEFSPLPKNFSNRVTHIYHGSEKGIKSAFDSFLVSPSLQESVLSIRVLRYRDEKGKVVPFSQNIYERLQQPSDHYPVILDLHTGPLIQSAY